SHPLREAVLQILLNDHGINRQPPTQITKDVTDVRKLIADEALSDHFLGLWPHLCQPPHKSFTQMLMRMVA
ncbi:hypothetical protein, partial [Acidithiobacillus thiooxidans]|uniref:hypothetical protein n=1 Tax=Acidithiobacillus thiooxidans TaxID=930 RepID=UPI000A993847